MLNKNGVRELAYIARVTNIAPMNANKLECVYINGWTCVCGKGDFKIGDYGVFFEPDSQLPDVAPFNEIEFLKSKNFKIKPQKIRGIVSQGLFMPFSAFVTGEGTPEWLNEWDHKMACNQDNAEPFFLTEALNITYNAAEDNARKAPAQDKYKKMAQRHPKIFKTRFARMVMRYSVGRKIMFFFFGKKKDKKNGWNWDWVSKSDQERVQNMPFVFDDKESTYIETVKIDGTSSTFVLEKVGKLFPKWKFSVCSRNVVFDDENQANYHSNDENVYWEVAKTWYIREFLEKYAAVHRVDGVALQGETAGCTLNGVKLQGDPHGFNKLRFFGYDLYVKGEGKTDILAAKEACEDWGIEWVPITNVDYHLPDTCDELLAHATGPCEASGASGLREGYVYRKNGCPSFSFKAVSPEYLVTKA